MSGFHSTSSPTVTRVAPHTSSRTVNSSSYLNATARLRPQGSLRPLTYFTLFGLLAATGLRVSEALHLVVNDITADGLLVRQTKFRQNRLVPLHETTAAALGGYLVRRRAIARRQAHVFVTTTGRPLS
jgi:integrase